MAPSRERARADIEAGRVLVAGSVATKPARMVDAGEAVQVVGPPPRFVWRGGEKLDAAHDRFAVVVEGRRALDAGASTGGFTDCLLQRGAASVVAVDVGYGQLHERLRADPRVQNLERTNVRSLSAADVGGPAELVVADLSFISLRTVLEPLLDLATGDADLVLLVKPQFEAGREEAARGKGVIRDPEVWRRVLAEVRAASLSQGAAMMGAMPSPITGAEGNVEFLAHCRAGATGGVTEADLAEVVAAAVVEHGR
jgi:23S rRNA (cytidine1920-2'-O)/16S rRNA (cytidine1409-2'-O)-methyltransferase